MIDQDIQRPSEHENSKQEVILNRNHLIIFLLAMDDKTEPILTPGWPEKYMVSNKDSRAITFKHSDSAETTTHAKTSTIVQVKAGVYSLPICISTRL